MLLILGKGGHHHGECSGILTGDQGIPTGGEYELLKLSLEVNRRTFVTREELLQSLGIPWRSHEKSSTLSLTRL